jgi:hypothetical protein
MFRLVNSGLIIDGRVAELPGIRCARSLPFGNFPKATD